MDSYTDFLIHNLCYDIVVSTGSCYRRETCGWIVDKSRKNYEFIYNFGMKRKEQMSHVFHERSLCFNGYDL